MAQGRKKKRVFPSDRKEGGRKGGREKREKRVRLSDDLLWGLHPVSEALSQGADRISEVIVAREHHGGKREEIIQLAKEAGVKLSFVDSLRLTGPDSATARHQGVIARMSSARLLAFSELVEKFSHLVQQGKKPRLLVLDSLQDPHNLGAAIRSAHGAGMDGVVITRERSAPLGGTAAKSAAGALAHMDICQVTNLADSLEELKKAGAWVFGALKERDSQSVYETDFNLPLCLVIGSEGKGIRPLIRKKCDLLVSIPMIGELDSLNSSVAAAVIMFETLRQRFSGGVS
ncbi:MAG: 23S rRNA (guanosine(2251)-2'-O)-methyltransferase RlmB [Thermodesulfobacteriota bacterium]